jgi:hypothetical protein
MEIAMTYDATDAPAQHRPTPPGLGERLALWGMAIILSMLGGVVLMFILDPLVGQQAARTIAKGISLAVLFEVGNGVRSVRSFLATASLSVAALAAFEWLWYRPG